MTHSFVQARPTRAAGIEIEQARRNMDLSIDPIYPADAERVIEQYAGLLERHTNENVYPAPVSALPYSKETIKRAIRTATETRAAMGRLNRDTLAFLESAYQSLADYVEEDVAAMMRQHRRACLALTNQSERRSWTDGPAWQAVSDTSAAVARVARAIGDEAEALRDEFRRWRLQVAVAVPLRH